MLLIAPHVELIRMLETGCITPSPVECKRGTNVKQIAALVILHYLARCLRCP
jgi:hypothetical protein